MIAGRSDRVRLLYIQPAEGFGGAERQGVLHMAQLARHGFDVIPVVGPGQPIREALAQQGISEYVFLDDFCHEAWGPVPRFGALPFAARFLADWWRTARTVYRIARERHVELIFANRSTGWMVAGGVARLLGIPQVWRGGSRITKRIEAVVMRGLSSVFGPDLLLANCEAVRADLAPQVSCPSLILPNGVDTRRFDPARVAPRYRQMLGLDADVPLVGLAARPAPEKGMELLARVVELTAQRVPAVRFLVAGEFGWRPHFEAMFAARGLADRLRFIGHVSEMEGFLRSCDVSVLTSKEKSIEGSPNSVLESMAMECPVMATSVGGVTETLTDGVQGFLVPPDDAEAFSGHLVNLLGDRELRRHMGAAGRARVLERHRLDRVVGDLAGMLHDVHAHRLGAASTVAPLPVDARSASG